LDRPGLVVYDDARPFRRFQLRSIEEQLPELTTFANTYATRDHSL